MFRTSALVLLMGASILAAAPDPTARSAVLAAQLATALAAQKLDAIATRDPQDPGRFIAALHYPNTQLLVVSARSASPELLEARLTHKQYRDIYADLQGAPVRGSSVFFQDMKADGLCTSREQAPDILYGADGKTMIFDADWRKHDLSQEEYERQLSAADQQYSRLLELLLAQVRPT